MSSEAVSTRPSTRPQWRMPWSAVAFLVILVVLVVAYVAVAFLFGRGLQDVLFGILVFFLILGFMAITVLWAWWWTRGFSKTQTSREK